MKKTIKDLFKLITAITTVAGILYVARDQIKAIIAKIKEVSDDALRFLTVTLYQLSPVKR